MDRAPFTPCSSKSVFRRWKLDVQEAVVVRRFLHDVWNVNLQTEDSYVLDPCPFTTVPESGHLPLYPWIVWCGFERLCRTNVPIYNRHYKFHMCSRGSSSWGPTHSDSGHLLNTLSLATQRELHDFVHGVQLYPASPHVESTVFFKDKDQKLKMLSTFFSHVSYTRAKHWIGTAENAEPN